MSVIESFAGVQEYLWLSHLHRAVFSRVICLGCLRLSYWPGVGFESFLSHLFRVGFVRVICCWFSMVEFYLVILFVWG